MENGSRLRGRIRRLETAGSGRQAGNGGQRDTGADGNLHFADQSPGYTNRSRADIIHTTARFPSRYSSPRFFSLEGASGPPPHPIIKSTGPPRFFAMWAVTPALRHPTVW